MVTDPQFEFVPWYTWKFPASLKTVDGYVREAKQCVMDLLKEKVKDQGLLDAVLEEVLRPYVVFMTECIVAGWKVVPKEKLTAGGELEKAYQQLARPKAAGWMLLDI